MSAPRPPQRREFLTGFSSADSGESPSGGVPPAPGPLFSFSANAMGCEFQILCSQTAQQDLAASIGGGFGLIRQLEADLSIFRDNSPVSDLNRLAGTRPVAVTPELFDLLEQARKISSLTEGAFDMTSRPLSQLWKTARQAGRLPTATDVSDGVTRVGIGHLRLDPAGHYVAFDHPELTIDLGGIGKGYALDQLASLLDNANVGHFLIHGGQSSIVARGQRDSVVGQADLPWTVGLAHPLVPDTRIAEIRLDQGCLGTSGSGRQSFIHGGRRYGHVIDPRTGWPAQHWLSVSVLADSALAADALATGLFVMDHRGVHRFCQRNPGCAVIAIAGDPAGSGGTVTVHNLDRSRLNWLDDTFTLSWPELPSPEIPD